MTFHVIPAIVWLYPHSWMHLFWVDYNNNIYYKQKWQKFTSCCFSASFAWLCKTANNWVSSTSLTVFLPCYVVKSTKEVKTNMKNHFHSLFDLSLLSTDKQETQESMARQEFLPLHPQQSPIRQSTRASTLSGTWKPRAGLPPHCLLCLPLCSSTEMCNSLDAVPPVSFTSGQEGWYKESI